MYIPEKFKIVNSEQQGTGTGKNQLILKTTSLISITTLINIFTSVDLKFKGIQSLKFKLWKRAFIINDNNTKIEKICRIMIKLNEKEKVNLKIN